MSWRVVPASELMVKRGGSVNPAKFPDETFELLSIPAFDKNQPEILKGSEIGSSKSCIEPGDVLLSKIVPHIRRCCVVPKKGNYRQIGSGEWIIFRDKRFDPGFLKHFFTSDVFHRQFMNTVAGVGGSLVRARPADVERIDIPLPPLYEQKRIASILDKADAIRRKRQQAIQLADEFLRAVFLDMFGDPVTNPKGWEVKPLKQLARVTTGNTPSRKEERFYGERIEWIKSDNINTPSHFLTKASESLSVEGKKVARVVGSGSILVTCIAGSFDCIGNAAYADREVAFNQQINALTPFEGVKSWFLYALILFSKKHIQSASTNSMKGMVSKGKMEEIPMICPPLSIQGEFQEAFLKFISVTDRLDRSFAGSTDVFDSLSQQAFSGEI